jgi:hypothetical protein
MHQDPPVRAAGHGSGVRVRGTHTAVVCALALVTLAALGACTAIAPPAAPPAAPSTGAPAAPGASPDFDGDGNADLVVGFGTAVPRVAVRYANGRTRDIVWEDISPQPDPGGFGQALVASDLNGDGFCDLAVTSPGWDTSALSVILGSPSGLDIAGAVTRVVADVHGAGRSLALVTEPLPVLVVGGGTQADAGVLLAYRVGADGHPADEPDRLTPASLGQPGLALGTRFGATLAASGWLLAIGAPGADIGTARQAGAVYTVDFRDGTLRSALLTQDSPGVADNPQTGDRFGAALAAGDGYLAIGVPGEDREDEHGHLQARAGLVQLFLILGTHLKADRAIDQRALPGDVVARDLFGSAVSMAHPCPKVVGVLVGAPATSIGAQAQAGAAWLVPVAGESGCVPLQFSDGNGLGGKAEANTVVGAAVSVLRRAADDGDTLVIVAQGIAEEGVAARILTLDYPYRDAPVVREQEARLAEEGGVTLSPAQG